MICLILTGRTPNKSRFYYDFVLTHARPGLGFSQALARADTLAARCPLVGRV